MHNYSIDSIIEAVKNIGTSAYLGSLTAGIPVTYEQHIHITNNDPLSEDVFLKEGLTVHTITNSEGEHHRALTELESQYKSGEINVVTLDIKTPDHSLYHPNVLYIVVSFPSDDIKLIDYTATPEELDEDDRLEMLAQSFIQTMRRKSSNNTKRPF